MNAFICIHTTAQKCTEAVANKTPTTSAMGAIIVNTKCTLTAAPLEAKTKPSLFDTWTISWQTFDIFYSLLKNIRY